MLNLTAFFNDFINAVCVVFSVSSDLKSYFGFQVVKVENQKYYYGAYIQPHDYDDEFDTSLVKFNTKHWRDVWVANDEYYRFRLKPEIAHTIIGAPGTQSYKSWHRVHEPWDDESQFEDEYNDDEDDSDVYPYFETRW